MRDVKLAVETTWMNAHERWDVTVWMIVAPGARYLLTAFTTEERDPMDFVAERFARLFDGLS